MQSQIAWTKDGGVVVQRGSGRRSRISCNGRECWSVRVLRCGRMWNKVSSGVATYIIPSGVK